MLDQEVVQAAGVALHGSDNVPSSGARPVPVPVPANTEAVSADARVLIVLALVGVLFALLWSSFSS